MPDLNMNELKLILLDDFKLVNLPGVRTQGPDELREQRGLDMSLFASGGMFVDQELGYAIARESLLRAVAQEKNEPPFLNLRPQYYDNWTAEVDVEKIDAPPLAPGRPWYLEGQHWPEERGSGVTVAVLDYGVRLHNRLKHRIDDSDFCSCAGPNTAREDISPELHGTRCAGVIAAADLDNTQTCPAPDCNPLYACVARKQMFAPNAHRLTISLADLLLMLSWAVHEQNACVVNMSFTIGRLNPDDTVVLERVTKRLRKKNRALVFAAAKEDGEEIAHPACISGIIGVAEYKKYSIAQEERLHIASGTGSTWKKRELIFGPGSNVESVEVEQESRYFTESSAACAYVSGVAALYIQRYWKADKDLHSILCRMFRDAKALPGQVGGRQRLAVQLPK